MRALFYLLIATLLVACAQEPVVQIKNKYIVVQPNASYMQDIKIAPPPEPVKYSEMEAVDKEKALIDWSDSLLQAIGDANRRLHAIRESVSNALKVYEEKE